MSEDELVERAAETLRRPVTMDPAIDARVMATVRALPRHREPRTAGWWAWLIQARTIRVSPLAALATAAVVLVAAVSVVPRLTTPAAPVSPALIAAAPDVTPGSSAAADSAHLVQFVFVAPTAQSVSLVGDFNNWEMGATPLAAGPSRSVWTVRVLLPNGRHRYAFVVDDSTWAADPSAPPAAGDDFGVPSSVVTVTGSSS
ncbi:MAG TPA: isoamylase early set domain-containing protein [Gemmatimonadaceae bacterium]|nr:isoamylase early set domain-containing protein [Gemmatimonadaceae bacterium]